MGGDRFDTSIEQHATAWKKLRDTDGGFNSNYGQYIFRGLLRGSDHGSQFDWVVDELKRDPDSRRACIVLLNRHHLRQDNVDVVCTYAMSFRIRQNRLNMSVSMRSNDVIFGMTNDVFCFSMLHEMLLVFLQSHYPDLRLGEYTHKVDSLHVYQRHFGMLQELVEQGMDGYYHIHVPPGDVHDFRRLSVEAQTGEKTIATMSRPSFALYNWIQENAQ